MAHEFGPHGVSVNAIAPGGIAHYLTGQVLQPNGGWVMA
jgi:NAD(P)-dependent dehydrogenase (short-subunit alcohol dehydrogenase family)